MATQLVYVGNALLWKFTANDAVVQRYLNTAERNAVTAWQNANLPIRFEFHPGHTTGEPLYIRVDGNADNANVPKVDTKDASASDFAANLESLSNYQKLVGGNLKGKKVGALLSQGDATTLRVLLNTEFDNLQLIAHRYWNNEDPPADPTAPAATRPCTATTHCTGLVQNTKGKSCCPVCYQYS